jgi:hypothetical protein
MIITINMSIAEQQAVKNTYYSEAMRYMENARDTLKKAGKEGRQYLDDKYVKSACGIAYSGVLKALDGYLKLKEVEKRKGRKSIEFYNEQVGKLDKKLGADLHNAYAILHLAGYYDGVTSVATIQDGFQYAEDIIKRIEP